MVILNPIKLSVKINIAIYTYRGDIVQYWLLVIFHWSILTFVFIRLLSRKIQDHILSVCHQNTPTVFPRGNTSAYKRGGERHEATAMVWMWLALQKFIY